MDSQLQAMSARLDAWSAEIEALACRYRRFGAPRRFDRVMYLDELKGLHAIARERFGAYRTAEGQKRPDLEPELQIALEELATALRRRPPS